MPADDPKLDPAALQARIDAEDALLNTRTQIFLVPLSVLVGALGVAGTVSLKLCVSVLGLLVTVFWIMCSLQSWQVIKRLTVAKLTNENNGDGDAPVEKTAQEALWRVGLRPTDVLAVMMPGVFLAVWTISTLVHLAEWYQHAFP